MHPDRFYPIVDTIAWVERLAKLGVRTLQLRAKELDQTAARELVRDALKAVEGTKCEIVVNDYWQAAIAEGADHVHLGQEDIETADTSTIKKAGLTLGISTHDHDELEIAMRHKPDYVALGPIYETTLKKMRFAPQGYARITEWKKLIGKIPLVAIGGIKLEHAKDIFAAGADSIAVVSDVTSNPNPDARIRDWLAHTRA
ncbi:MAG: thiamine phosphate synthase [Xanthobacteraceae bacterium]|nr:thiamine phosphate synthase [Xanthobacteraceae bacterium]MBX3533720.1 thiamine phosphate synthase [Xanthobacteraceae bacterium]MBX3549003.1 thiamine phosphate synthase [Xanthobacteraceae bacterium]MCW5675468.1 thiamine phosphate synthase [Xanthobacteraceae bacterium]MCW5676544.1 thiamine phosphate synthase [Xanthobacteraceae bacterium]